MAELLREFKARLRQSPPSGDLTVSIPSPLRQGLSIPRVFKVLVNAWEQYGPSRPTVVVRVASDDVVDHLVAFLPKAQRLKQRFQLGALSLELVASDLLSADTEAIVNASNRELRLGGGVSGAIREAAWPSLQAALNRLAAQRVLQDGDCVLTGAHGIPRIRGIIHAVAATGTSEVLRRAILNVIAACGEHGIRSVAFPALGTGAGGMPMEECARTFGEILSDLAKPQGPDVSVHVITRSDFKTFADVFQQCFCDESAS